MRVNLLNYEEKSLYLYENKVVKLFKKMKMFTWIKL